MNSPENSPRSQNAGKLRVHEKKLEQLEKRPRTFITNQRINRLEYLVGKEREIAKMYREEDKRALTEASSTKVDKSTKQTTVTTNIDNSKNIGFVKNGVKVPKKK